MPETNLAPALPEWEHWIRFERVETERNRHREYEIAIEADLFGE